MAGQAPPAPSRLGPANPSRVPVSDLPRPVRVTSRVIPMAGSGLVSFVAGLVAGYGEIALILFGSRRPTSRPEVG